MPKKTFSVLFIAILVCGLAFGFAHIDRVHAASSIPKPSVPEFSLKFVAHPYDVPPTYEIDPYTGKNILTSQGYHAENKSIEVTIKNQPFASTPDESGNYANLYYFIRFKGHYTDEWGYWGYYPSNPDDNYSTAIATPVNASQSEYTTITLGLGSYRFGNVPADGQIDFQVEAFIGYAYRVEEPFLSGIAHYYRFSAFERSGWSNTQTVAIEENANANPAPSMSPSPFDSSPSTPQEPTAPQGTDNSETIKEFGEVASLAIIGLGVVLALVGVSLLVYSKKRINHELGK